VPRSTAPQLRSRFGLFETWASFTYISSDAKKKPADDGDASTTAPAGTTVPATTTSPSSGGTTPPVTDTTGGQAASVARVASIAPSVLTGTIQPAKRGRRLAVQRRDGTTWRTIRTVHVGAGGSYHATLPGPGTYRVALGDVTGPPVDVR
jgi:stage II sporulation protein D